MRHLPQSGDASAIRLVMQGMVLTLVLFVGPLVVMAVGGLLFARLTRGLTEPGHCCKRCGYDLRSLGEASRCPECDSTGDVALLGSARWTDVVEIFLLVVPLCAVSNWARWGLDPDYWWVTLLLGPLFVMPGMITFAVVASIRVSERAVPRGVVWVWGLASGAGCAAMRPAGEFLSDRWGLSAELDGFSVFAVPFVVHYVSVPLGLAGLAVARRFVRRA